MESSDMMSGKNLSLNDFVSAQVKQLNKVLVDPYPHPLEKISQIQGILRHIYKRKRKENLVVESVKYFWGLAKVMMVIQLIVDGLTVTTDNMTHHQEYYTGDDQSWTKTNVNRALKDLKKLDKVLNRLISPLVIDGQRTLFSTSQLESKLTSFLRFIDFRQYLDSTSKAGILADCPDDHCAICLVQKLTVDLKFTVLDSCRHIFCTSCIKTWLEKEKSCPMCRRRVDWTEAYSTSTNICDAMMFAGKPLFALGPHQIVWQNYSTEVNHLIDILESRFYDVS